MNITEAQLGWLMGCALLVALLLGWPALSTTLALLKQRLLGRLYWQVRTAIDRRCGV